MNLQSQKEKLMFEAKEIVDTRADELSAQHDLDDFEGTLDWVNDVIKGKSEAVTEDEKIAEIWQSVMTLFNNLHQIKQIFQKS